MAAPTVRLEQPDWWASGRDWRAQLLRPLSALYGGAAALRWRVTRPAHVNVPVLCIGNLTVGGAGKTPAALMLASMAGEMGLRPAFLTRGYRGRLPGPHQVDLDSDTARDVGDEALLLARAAPTIVCRDRPAGARAAIAAGADLIIMDDGFQNPSLHKDLAILVIDGASGVGNGLVLPAGPLRAPLDIQLAHAGAVIVVGEPAGSQALIDHIAAVGLPILRADFEPVDPGPILGARVVAFAGIGRPGKFFATLKSGGADVIAEVAFPDHHAYTNADATELLDLAEAGAADLMTTEKDWVRLAEPEGALGRLRQRARPFAVMLRVPDEGPLKRLLQERLRPET